jgi:hypothetical protein
MIRVYHVNCHSEHLTKTEGRRVYFDNIRQPGQVNSVGHSG